MLDQTHINSLFENATEGIILTNASGTVILSNPAAERMFDYPAGELIGKPIEILIPDKYKPHHHLLREGFNHSPSNRVMGQGRDLNGRRKDGTDLPVEVSLSHYQRKGELLLLPLLLILPAGSKLRAAC